MSKANKLISISTGLPLGMGANGQLVAIQKPIPTC